MPSASDYVAVDGVVDDLTEKCMKQRGFEFIPYPPRPATRIFKAAMRYGQLNAADARSTGYRSVWNAARIPPEYTAAVDAVDQERSKLGPAYDEALYGSGDNSTGCFHEASSEVWGAPSGLTSVPGYEDLVQLSADALTRVLGDPDAEAANTEWVECMRAEGFVYEDWQAARLRYRPSADAGAMPSQEETNQALADVDCRAKTDLVRRLFEIDARIQTEMLSKVTLDQSIRDAVAAAVSRARGE